MLILITENRQKPKTEWNYFEKFFKMINERELLEDEPKNVKSFKNIQKLRLMRKEILGHKIIFLICDNENKNKKTNLDIEEEITLWKKPIKVIDTNNHKKEYIFENFLCSHNHPNNSKKDYLDFSGDNHKSKKDIFGIAARKFHQNIMRKDSKHLVELIKHLGKKTYGAYKIMKYITTKLKK